MWPFINHYILSNIYVLLSVFLTYISYSTTSDGQVSFKGTSGTQHDRMVKPTWVQMEFQRF